MASSDNVLRGGLTQKSVDVEQLLRTVSYADGRPTVLSGRQIGPGVQAYETAAEEFVLDRVRLEADESLHAGVEHGVECFITLEGSAVLVCTDREMKLGKGAAAMAPAGIPYELRAMAAGALVFRSRIPAP
jgi:mannose-6-phosphate isomerase